MLKPDGLIYCELAGFANQWISGNGLGKFVDGFGAPQLFWLTPRLGEMHTAVPLRDEATVSYFVQHGLYSPSIDLRVFKRAARFVNKHLLFSRFTQRYGILVGHCVPGPTDAPPKYLRSIAQNAGIDIDRHRWGLAARGEYSSRKVLFFLFNRNSGLPEYIVKLTRDPIHNYRLENEYNALRLLHEKGIGDHKILPQAVFSGYHADLAIVGETMIDGVPLQQQAKATPDCPYTRAAIDWLVELGVASAGRTSATPLQVAEGLEVLFKRFGQIYQLAPAHHAFLAEQISTIACSISAFPLVFQHGDPGTWNIMVTQNNQIAFLDWEAFEPQGMPLWDLFYFMRSYSMAIARAHGTHDRIKGFAQQFLSESPFSSLVIEATKRYCERIGVPCHLVEPLFYTCWMHRALKESTRLTSAKLERGHYVSLLRLCINQRTAWTLRHLFSLHTLETANC